MKTMKTIKNYLKRDGISYKTINTKNAKGIMVSVNTKQLASVVRENAPRIRKNVLSFVKKVAKSVATR